MSYDPKEDAEIFGEDEIIYCGQHLRPHRTGWCTVGPEHKVGLGIKFTGEESLKEAALKCRRLGLKLFEDVQRGN